MPRKIYTREDFATEKEWQNRLRIRRNILNYTKKKYATMTPEEKQAYIDDQVKRAKERKAKMTPEEREAERLRTNARGRESKARNKEATRLRRIAYRERHNELFREYRKDPMFRIAHGLRNSMNRLISSDKKSAKTIELLGCSWEDFKIYIEKQFSPGMTWENYGKKGWWIDHIKPLLAFDNLEDPAQQRECCHFTNLKPMWGNDNVSKSSWWNGVLYRRAKKKKPDDENPLDTAKVA